MVAPVLLLVTSGHPGVANGAVLFAHTHKEHI